MPYTIRHTLATWMSEQNVPEGELVAWFGHGKESTTRRWYIKRRVYRPDYLADRGGRRRKAACGREA